jgi:hypothetical protein
VTTSTSTLRIAAQPNRAAEPGFVVEEPDVVVVDVDAVVDLFEMTTTYTISHMRVDGFVNV